MTSIYDQIEQERAKRAGMRNIGKNLLIGAAGALAPVTGGLSLAAIPAIKGIEYATQLKSERPDNFGEYALDITKDTLPAVMGYGMSEVAAGTGLGKLFGNIKPIKPIAPIAENGAYISKNAPTHKEGGTNINVAPGEIIIPKDMQAWIDEADSDEEKAKRYEQVVAELKQRPLGEGGKAEYGGVPMNKSLYDATLKGIEALKQLPIQGGTSPKVTVEREKTFQEKTEGTPGVHPPQIPGEPPYKPEHFLMQYPNSEYEYVKSESPFIKHMNENFKKTEGTPGVHPPQMPGEPPYKPEHFLMQYPNSEYEYVKSESPFIKHMNENFKKTEGTPGVHPPQMPGLADYKKTEGSPESPPFVKKTEGFPDYEKKSSPYEVFQGRELPKVTGERDKTYQEKIADYNKRLSRNQKILSGLQAGIAGASLLQNAFGKDSEKYVPETLEKKQLKSPLTETKSLYDQSIASDRNMLYKSLRERGADTSTMLGVHANIADARNKEAAELGKLQKEHEATQAQLDLGVEQQNVQTINQGKQYNIQKQMAENTARTEAQKGNWLGMINALSNIYDVDAQLGKQGMTVDYLIKLLEENKDNPEVKEVILGALLK